MAKISVSQLKQLVEAAIFIADQPLSTEQLQESVLEGLEVSSKMLQKVLAEIQLDYQPRGVQLVEVASGYRFQSMDSLSPWLGKLWREHAPRYSRATLETLALIAYRQPITRGEIEDVRGVVVSSQIIKTLVERDWIKVIGHKEVPGRPALYATTKSFLDYFSLASLSQLPAIEEFVERGQNPDTSAQASSVAQPSESIELLSATQEPEQLH